jgi:glycosyltransferase involved in cell wall biosynthesis
MNDPIVSVVVIFRDVEPFLEEAIESVLAQDWPHWELILLDDGSADGSSRIAQSYAAQHPVRIRYLDHAGHACRGTAASRNAGVVAARGAYVAFLDGDDVYLPGRLRLHAAVLESHPDVAMMQSCLEYWRSWEASLDGASDERERAPLGDQRGLVEPPALLLLLLETANATAAGTCSLTIRRDLYLGLGGCDESFPGLFEDQVLATKLYLQHSVYVMPEVLARYRRRAGSLVDRAGEAGLRAARGQYLDWLERYLMEIGANDARVARALKRALFEYRNPGLWRLRQVPGDMLRCMREIGYALLPDRAAGPVRALWRGYKERSVDRRLERARRSATGRP